MTSGTPSKPPDLISRRDGDLLRSTASFLVVVIHCISLWVKDFYATHDFLSPGFVATVFDQLSRFTVPAFFFLSGYGLTQQFMAKPESLKDYYRRRLFKISLPFFAWSALTFYRPWALLTALPWTTNPLHAVGGFLDLLLLRGFDYQYYFLIVIFQFYVIFPFIHRLGKSRWFVFLCLLIQLPVMSPIEGYLGLVGWTLPHLYSFLLLFYVFYFVAGIHAALHRDLFAGLLERASKLQVWAFWFGALGLTIAEYWINISVLKKPLPYADHFNRWAVVVYCFATFLLLLKYRETLRLHVHENPRWQFVYAVLTPFSFFVYLAHTHFLRLADHFLYGLNPLYLFGRVAFVACMSYLLAWTLQIVLENHPRIRFALGLPKPPLRRADFPFQNSRG